MKIKWGLLIGGAVAGMIVAYIRVKKSPPSGNTQATFMGR